VLSVPIAVPSVQVWVWPVSVCLARREVRRERCWSPRPKLTAQSIAVQSGEAKEPATRNYCRRPQTEVCITVWFSSNFASRRTSWCLSSQHHGSQSLGSNAWFCSESCCDFRGKPTRRPSSGSSTKKFARQLWDVPCLHDKWYLSRSMSFHIEYLGLFTCSLNKTVWMISLTNAFFLCRTRLVPSLSTPLLVNARKCQVPSMHASTNCEQPTKSLNNICMCICTASSASISGHLVLWRLEVDVHCAVHRSIAS
jgi:hypothetical protein